MKTNRQKFFALLWSVAVLSMAGCEDGGINIFSIQDDIDLGNKVAQQIESDPQYHILSETQYANAYAYLNNLRNTILNSGVLNHKNDFEWKIKIIHDDTTQNAFCTPGGHIYVYTGLIKYLDNASSLAGVLGHEMAHADRRHSTDLLTQAYGVETLLAIVLGNNQSQLSEIGAQLLLLSFSRGHETEADEYSVRYLCPTAYRADGAADFFIKIEQAGGVNIPEFLSTHPNPDNRIANIQSKKTSLNCNDADNHPQSVEVNDYNAFKNMLP